MDDHAGSQRGWYQSSDRLQVVVDADLPAFGPLEKRVRGIASIAGSHRGLRTLLNQALADARTVSIFEAVGDVTTVRLVPKSRRATAR